VTVTLICELLGLTLTTR